MAKESIFSEKTVAGLDKAITGKVQHHVGMIGVASALKELGEFIAAEGGRKQPAPPTPPAKNVKPTEPPKPPQQPPAAQTEQKPTEEKPPEAKPEGEADK